MSQAKPIDVKEILALLGAKEVEISVLRQQVAVLEKALRDQGRGEKAGAYGLVPGSPGEPSLGPLPGSTQ